MSCEKMDTIKVQGKNSKHKVLVYAISTCAWCKLTKRFLKDNEVEYEYIDVDLCGEDDREKIRRDILNRGGSLSYPTIVIDDKVLVTGFRKDMIKEALEI
jgi:glutaredoxin-like protein NrdH